MGYGEIERRYAEPFANALVSDASFRIWVLSQTEFAPFADGARLLHEEMRNRRSSASQTWWRSHFSEACRCAGCGGKETDILAIFAAAKGFRFALHVEVKHPADKFKSDGIQARGYPIRAACWVANPPRSVPPHHGATTVLLFSEAKRGEYAPHLHCFKTFITFETLKDRYPEATALGT